MEGLGRGRVGGTRVCRATCGDYVSLGFLGDKKGGREVCGAYHDGFIAGTVLLFLTRGDADRDGVGPISLD